jgi:hypothetical protein
MSGLDSILTPANAFKKASAEESDPENEELVDC